MGAVTLRKALDPLVLAIDVGSRGSRVRLFDATGARLKGLRARLSHQFLTAADGTATVDPDQIVSEVSTLLDQVLAERQLNGRIAAVAMDTFASSLVGVDAAGKAVTPCFTYADSRPAADVLALRALMDEAAVQQRTGCRFHTSYLTARLRWLYRTMPEVCSGVARWLSLGEYVYAALLGEHAVSYSTAAWTGLLNRLEGEWDKDLIVMTGAAPEQFSPIHDVTEPLLHTSASAAQRWPALAHAAWFPAIADGYASNVGAGAADAATMGLSAATSGAMRLLLDAAPQTLPSGLWCYRVDRRQHLLGGALNDAARIDVWARRTLRLPEDPALLNAELAAPPRPLLPLVLPFLTGERSPGWAAGARAVFATVADATTPLDLYHAAMEAVALRYAAVFRDFATAGPLPDQILASGTVVETLPAWLTMLAGALGRPVTPVLEKQITLRGTALTALAVAAPGVSRTPPELGAPVLPHPDHAAYYQERLDEQEQLYRSVIVRST